jgi:epoxyqueuosine reductase
MTPKAMRERHTALVKKIAAELGFDFCGISEATFLEEEAPRLEAWLKQAYHGKMHYMENHFDKRLDPRKLVEGARSVVSLLYNYYPPETLPQEGNLKLSKYAYGKDYHKVIKKKLKHFMQRLQSEVGEVHGRAFVDSAPVMDKVWAKRSGLGWIGKHSNLINRKMGSFFFIAELIIDLDLEPDGPIKDYCGTCTRCIDACPTGAIVAPYVVDGSRCISYLTIELKDNLPAEFKDKMQDWIFGCDICQDVCPWNRFARPHGEADFMPSEALKNMRRNDWIELTEEVFENLFRGSAVKRTGYEGLKRNIRFVTDEKKEPLAASKGR